jgi:1-acyl-sn-glycerol-3-phosphate acyltransferase
MKLLSDIKNGTSHSIEYLLSNKVNKTLSKHGIIIRKIFSPIIRKVYSTQTEYKLIVDSREDIPRNVKSAIFIINHRQADDIVLAAQVINRSAYIVFGNSTLMLETTNGLGLWVNGVYILDRNDKDSRKATSDKMRYTLKRKCDNAVYAEGYWNLNDNGLADEIHGADDHNSENWLIQDLNIGAFKIAQEMGVPVIPVILHYDEVGEKRCYGSRGKPFYINKDDDVFAKKDEFKEIMQTMYYESMEKHSSYKKEELEASGKSLKEQWIELKEELRAACDIEKVGYHLDLENEKLIGKAKVVNSVITNEEAFEHLDKINYNIDNSFLLSKNITGRRK